MRRGQSPISLKGTSLSLGMDLQAGMVNLTACGQGQGQTMLLMKGIFGAAAFSRGGQGQILTTAGGSRICLESQAEVYDLGGRGMRTTLALDDAGLVLHWQITRYLDHPLITLQLSLINHTDRPMPVDWFSPLALSSDRGGELLPEIPVRNWRCLCNGFQSWSPAYVLGMHDEAIRPVNSNQLLLGYNHAWPMEYLPRLPGHFISEWLSAVVDAESGQALTVGFVTGKDQLAHIECAFGERSNPRFFLTRSMADGILLEPGKTLRSEKLMVGCHGNPLDGLDAWAKMARRETGISRIGRGSRVCRKLSPGRRVPVGWCSWSCCFRDISERIILENLAYLAGHRKSFPLDYFQIDDGYQRAIGDWEADEEKFPGGLKYLAGKIREAGLWPGLWLAPFLVQEKSDLFRQHPHWLIRDRNGCPVSAGRNWDDQLYGLDPTHPQVRDWLCSLIETVTRDFGFRLLKLDFLSSAALPGRFSDPTATRAGAFRQGLSIIRRAAGDDTFIIACGAPLAPSAGLVEAMRIGPDVSTGWENPERSAPAAGNAIRNSMIRSFIFRGLWINDPDSLIMRVNDPHLTSDEVLSLCTAAALSGGLLSLGDRMADIITDEGRRNILSRLIPPYGQAALPRDLFGPHSGPLRPPRLLDLAVKTGFDCWHVVGLFNWKETEETLELDLGHLGLATGPGHLYHACDFWQETYRGRFEQGLSLPTIPPHGCRLLGIRKDRKTPFLLASHIHFTQGAIELAGLRYDRTMHGLRADERLTVLLNPLAHHQSGILIFFFPDGLESYEIMASPAGFDGKCTQADRHLLAVEVSFDTAGEKSQVWVLQSNLPPFSTITISVSFRAGRR
ncbi:MAG: alpha-galactosidase [bacterium]